MGIFGLTSHLATKNRPSINLTKIAGDPQNESGLTVLVDGLSVLLSLMARTSILNHLLPDYNLLHLEICKLHNAFKLNNVRLVYYFDNASGDESQKLKERTVYKRTTQKISALVELEDYLNGIAPSSRTPSAKALSPPLFSLQCKRTLESLGATVIQCIGEADFALVKDGQSPDVFAIMVCLPNSS